jgi:hypothetical protein
MLSGCDETDRVPQAGRMHLAQGIRQKRVPVPHPDVDRERMARCVQADAQSFRLPSRDLRDRRDTAKELVVVRDFLDAFGTDTAAAEDIRQERSNVVEPLWPAKRDDENGIKGCARQPSSA